MKTKKRASKQFQRGQAVSEYLILAALIGVASIGIVQVLGGNIRSRLSMVSDALIGKKTEIEGTKATEEHYKVRSLEDFNDAIEEKKNK